MPFSLGAASLGRPPLSVAALGPDRHGAADSAAWRWKYSCPGSTERRRGGAEDQGCAHTVLPATATVADCRIPHAAVGRSHDRCRPVLRQGSSTWPSGTGTACVPAVHRPWGSSEHTADNLAARILVTYTCRPPVRFGCYVWDRQIPRNFLPPYRPHGRVTHRPPGTLVANIPVARTEASAREGSSHMTYRMVGIVAVARHPGSPEWAESPLHANPAAVQPPSDPEPVAWFPSHRHSIAEEFDR